MKSSGLFKQLCQYDYELNFQRKIAIKEDMCNEWRAKHNAPDADGDDIIRSLYNEYEKGIFRHQLSKSK